MTDEHTVAIVSFEGAIKREVKRIRTALQQMEDLSAFKIEVSAEGRVHEGDVKLTYTVGREYGGNVQADTLQAALDEFMRRHGWKKAHNPVAITFQGTPD